MAKPIFRESDIEVLAALPLHDLNDEISRCLSGTEYAGTTPARKAYFKRLVLLEKIREEVHGIPAKQRAFRKS